MLNNKERLKLKLYTIYNLFKSKVYYTIILVAAPLIISTMIAVSVKEKVIINEYIKDKDYYTFDIESEQLRYYVYKKDSDNSFGIEKTTSIDEEIETTITKVYDQTTHYYIIMSFFSLALSIIFLILIKSIKGDIISSKTESIIKLGLVNYTEEGTIFNGYLLSEKKLKWKYVLSPKLISFFYDKSEFKLSKKFNRQIKLNNILNEIE